MRNRVRERRTQQGLSQAELAAALGVSRQTVISIENGRYLVTADPARGGTVSVTDKRTGARVLAGPGNELVIQDEYAQHPKHGEGPWHLSPKGPGTGSSSVPAAVRVESLRRRLDDLEVLSELAGRRAGGRVSPEPGRGPAGRGR